MTRSEFIKYTSLAPFGFFFGQMGRFGESHESTPLQNEQDDFPHFATDRFFVDIHAHVTLKPFNSDD